MEITFGDLFAGGGGVTTGALSVPGVKVIWALNHDKTAIKTHGKNHPETKHFEADITTQSLDEIDPVDFLWGSIECTQHSNAKGGGSKKIGSYMLGWELIRYIVHCDPTYLGIENVPEFMKWSPVDEDGNPIKGREGDEYRRWVKAIQDLGYDYDYSILQAADYGCPTRRKRYFGMFAKKGSRIKWKLPTHVNNWVACKPYIDLANEGESIFGRKFNENIRAQHRRPLVHNTLRRLAGGIKKHAKEVYFIMQYYGSGTNCQSIDKPLNAVVTKDRHVLVKVEKFNFIQDHCHMDSYQILEEPLGPQLTRQTKQLVTVEKQHFISAQYSSNGRPELNNQSLDKPLGAMTTDEKFQFVTAYFSSGGKPETQNQSLDKPLNAILTGANKHALVTAELGFLDFDVKTRFLTAEELSAIMGFPEGYFEGVSKKAAIKMIGNSVPVELAASVIEPIVEELRN